MALKFLSESGIALDELTPEPCPTSHWATLLGACLQGFFCVVV